jgi:hypothetical protein
VLGHAVVGSIDLANVNLIADGNERGQQVEHPVPILGSEESLDVFKNERQGACPCYDLGKTGD